MLDGPRTRLETQILEFVGKHLVADPNIRITATTPLVSSGLVDSFDLVDLLDAVERITGKNLPASQISPQDMESVEQILNLLERF